MAAIKAIRNGIETRLDTISGLRGYNGGTINPPSYIVQLGEDGVDYHAAFQDGLTEVHMRIVVYVSTAYTRVARDQVDDFLDVVGAKSIKAAVEADPTLGGIVDDLIVSRGRQLDIEVLQQNVVYLGADLSVTVLAS
jgi:hypothetical protein